MAATLRITAKGQVTLRKGLLRHLGVVPGGQVVVDLLPEGRASLRRAVPPGDIADFIGSMQRPGTRVLSIKQIEDLAAGGWSGER